MCNCKVESALCVVVSTMISNTRQQDLCIDWLDDHLFASAPKYSTSRRLSSRYLINQTCSQRYHTHYRSSHKLSHNVAKAQNKSDARHSVLAEAQTCGSDSHMNATVL